MAIGVPKGVGEWTAPPGGSGAALLALRGLMAPPALGPAADAAEAFGAEAGGRTGPFADAGAGDARGQPENRVKSTMAA
jgi:hypothetical protein